LELLPFRSDAGQFVLHSLDVTVPILEDEELFDDFEHER
jgi:hypothetical protein